MTRYIRESFRDESLVQNERISLCDALDRVLNKGAVVVADISISVADVDLIYVSLQALITSVETGRKLRDQAQKHDDLQVDGGEVAL